MKPGASKSSRKKQPNPAGQASPGPKDAKPRRGLRLVVSLGGALLAVLVGVWLAPALFPRRPDVSRRPAGPTSAPGTNVPTGQAATFHQTDPAELGAALITRGNEQLARGDLAGALASYRAAEKLLPEDEDVFYNLGIALTRAGQTNEAIAAYETALKLFPDYAEAHNNLGNLLLRAGRVDEAVEHFRAAITTLPDYATAHNNLGNALRLAGWTNEALEHFARAVALNTNYWEARFNLATLYRETGRPDEAAREYREVLRLRPDFAPAAQALEEIRTTPAPPPLR